MNHEGEEPPITRVAWIGLGTMGMPMAHNLAKSGVRVLGVDIDPAAREMAPSKNIIVTETLAEAVEYADAVVTILPADAAVRSVFNGPEGIWENTAQGALLVDCSTVGIETSRWCHERSQERGFDFVDSPISGGVPGAVEGTLTLMFGGDPRATARAHKVFDAASSNRIEAGGPTAGIASKICNNLMFYVNMISAAEGLQLAEHLGLDLEVFREIALLSSGRSFPLELWNPKPGLVEGGSPSDRNFAPDWPAAGGLKDITLALDAGKERGLQLPGAGLFAQQMQDLIDEGLGDRDFSLIVKHTSPRQEVKGFIPEPS